MSVLNIADLKTAWSRRDFSTNPVSRAAGERWLADHSGVEVVDVDQAREIARSYVVGELNP